MGRNDDVICISEDDESARMKTDAEEVLVIQEFGLDSPEHSKPLRKRVTKRPSENTIELLGSPSSSGLVTIGDDDDGYETPPRQKRRVSNSLKPITPSSTMKSSMNASLVFDIVTALSTKDPGVAIAALRSIVVLGKEYPSDLLYDELIDRIQSVDAIEYADAVSIYASLVFVLDRAASCSCDLTFPHQWDPFANALQDLAVKSVGDSWRRTLLVVQFYIYALKTDFELCRKRHAGIPHTMEWVQRTRLFVLLNQQESIRLETNRKNAARVKVHNNFILQAIGFSLQLWSLVYGDKSEMGKEEQETLHKSQLEIDATCVAVVRLIEMLFMCTDQEHNILQRVHAGLLDLPRNVRTRFSQVLQLSELKLQLATMVVGHIHKPRSKEHEWYECNAIGRVLQGLPQDPKSEGSSSVDGFSRSHLALYMTTKRKDDFTRLLHEIVKMDQQETSKAPATSSNSSKNSCKGQK